jgi:hypothetical protein
MQQAGVTALGMPVLFNGLEVASGLWGPFMSEEVGCVVSRAIPPRSILGLDPRRVVTCCFMDSDSP